MVLFAALLGIATVGGLLVGTIGFVASYDTLSAAALTWGFAPSIADWFPIAVDASIVAFLATDLLLLMMRVPWAVLRPVAYLMTGLTIWFNASSQVKTGELVPAGAHAAMPVLFVVGVEALRHLVIKKAHLRASFDRIPLARFVVEPVSGLRLYRRMRLEGVTSWREMQERERDRRGYDQWLQRLCATEGREPTADELLPRTMARYGMTVDQALALPAEQAEQARQRAEAEEQRRRDARTRREEAEQQAARRREAAAHDTEMARLARQGETEAATAEQDAQATARRILADAQAEATRVREQAIEQARQEMAGQIEAAEKRITELNTLSEKQRERLAAARGAEEAARLENEAARKTRDTAVAEKETALAKAAKAEAAERAERLGREAEEARLATAKARLAAAETEEAALEAEARMNLSAKERTLRRLHRMAAARSMTVADLPLSEIENEFGVSTATASRYRVQAADLPREQLHAA
ncbi:MULTISPECIES: DUF2637 domain-containing protein [Streptomyces]|uniref:DUF2637 domain-containing protein n=1 Tax=Streptomyces evansiae TaxID=3075535 RepID=A0ABU2RBR2_9ACTN|nr:MULTISPECIES: DUF2637 domain-containing protein [unclassified Streptomyces]MDT0412740.1 DUF2637 domain-containing protein [Streptomyces sp. DSM 41979]MYQ56434.1 DUF2637 domain-containing protein [Streptomyces sp. SID4926]